MRNQVSVVIATLNGERFLSEQLTSLLEQTAPPFEVLASDDGSSDGTLEILRSFAETAPFPVSIHENDPRLGFAENFLSAAERCKGSLIAFADQDDVWYPEKLQTVVEEFGRQEDATVLVHRLLTVDAHLRPLNGNYPAIPAVESADAWMLVPGVAMVIDAQLARTFDWRARPPSRDLDALDHLMDHDEWFYFLGFNSETLIFVDRPLVKYRQHQSNVVGAPVRTVREKIRRALQEDFATRTNRTAAVRAYAASAVAQRTGAPPATPGAIAYWRRYLAYSEARDLIYAGSSRLVRAHALAQLAWRRGYQATRRGGLGRLALLRDLRDLLIVSRAAAR
jgi:glycosyltransferase involved in cell wall biosynthesis